MDGQDATQVGSSKLDGNESPPADWLNDKKTRRDRSVRLKTISLLEEWLKDADTFESMARILKSAGDQHIYARGLLAQFFDRLTEGRRKAGVDHITQQTYRTPDGFEQSPDCFALIGKLSELNLIFTFLTRRCMVEGEGWLLDVAEDFIGDAIESYAAVNAKGKMVGGRGASTPAPRNARTAIRRAAARVLSERPLPTDLGRTLTSIVSEKLGPARAQFVFDALSLLAEPENYRPGPIRALMQAVRQEAPYTVKDIYESTARFREGFIQSVQANRLFNILAEMEVNCAYTEDNILLVRGPKVLWGLTQDLTNSAIASYGLPDPVPAFDYPRFDLRNVGERTATISPKTEPHSGSQIGRSAQKKRTPTQPKQQTVLTIRNKREALQQADVLIAKLIEARAYDPLRHHTERSRPGLRVSDEPAFIADMSKMISVLTYCRAELAKKNANPEKVAKSGIDLSKAAQKWLERFAVTTASLTGVAFVGYMLMFLQSLGLQSPELAQLAHALRAALK
jgi:hypothetical protein